MFVLGSERRSEAQIKAFISDLRWKKLGESNGIAKYEVVYVGENAERVSFFDGLPISSYDLTDASILLEIPSCFPRTAEGCWKGTVFLGGAREALMRAGLSGVEDSYSISIELGANGHVRSGGFDDETARWRETADSNGVVKNVIMADSWVEYRVGYNSETDDSAI